jgi:hypothetical protein
MISKLEILFKIAEKYEQKFKNIENDSIYSI